METQTWRPPHYPAMLPSVHSPGFWPSSASRRPGSSRRAQPSLCRLPQEAAHTSCMANSRGFPELLCPALPPARDFSNPPALETVPLSYPMQVICSSELEGAVPGGDARAGHSSRIRYLWSVTAVVVVAVGRGESTEDGSSTLSWSSPALF